MTDLSEIRALSIPDEASLNRGPAASLRMAQAFTIADNDDYGMAAEELAQVKAAHKAIEAKRTAITVPMNNALKAVNDLFRQPLAALAGAEDLLKRSMLTYSNEKDRQAAEERRAAQALIDAERKRLADEADKIAAQARETQRLGDEETARLQRVAREEQGRLEREGNAAAAQKVREQAEADRVEAQRVAEANAQVAQAQVAAVQATATLITAPGVSIAQAPAIKGISTAKSVDFEVHDLLLLVKYIAENPALLSLLKPDDIRLRAYTKSLGMSCRLPGVTVREKSTMSARAAA